MSPQLILPTTDYKESYLEALSEFSKEHLELFEYAPVTEITSDFGSYVQKLRGYAQGLLLPTGYLPHTEFWLVDDDKYLGRLDIRHDLNQFLLDVGGHIGYDIRPSMQKKGYGTKILALGLLEAKKLGLEKILLTCTDGNIASEKIIVSNGGVYEDTRFHQGHKVNKKRFWIDLSG